MSASPSRFQKIGPRTSLYTPDEPAPAELIVICTWLGAAAKHINKYVAMYQRIAPGAHILLIESNVPILVSSYARQHRHLEAAARAVLDVVFGEGAIGNDKAKRESVKPRVLLHTFSNGGTNTATQLLILLRQKRAQPLSLAGIVFDSSPSKGTYWKSHTAMVLSLPPDPVTQVVGTIAVHVLLCMLYTWIACGNENPASLQRRTMLAKDTVVAEAPGEEAQARYIYSKADRMCWWEDVHDHADAARHGGWGVEEIVFEGTAHCAHYSSDADRYEDTVQRLWEGKQPQKQQQGPSVNKADKEYAAAKL